MKTVHVAAGIIQRDGGEVLAVQRGYGDMDGLWEFPGGKVENGETPAQACERELLEELQVRVTGLQDFYTLEYDYPSFHLSMNCFFCRLAEGEGEPQRSDRQRELRWVPKQSLATLEWMPADIELVELLEALGAEEAAERASAIEPSVDEPSAARSFAERASADNPAATTFPTKEPSTGKPNAGAPSTKKPSTGKPTAAASSVEAPRAPKSPRKKRARKKPDLLDGVDTSSLSTAETALVRRRAAVRKSMQGNKRRDTKPELLVRQRLRAAGLTGYRLDWAKAPGRPDIAFPGRKVAIFVNGCYWHRCPHCSPSVPRKNVEFWEAKFRRNVERDTRALAELEELGWLAITIWECELKRDRIDETMDHVIETILEASAHAGKSTRATASAPETDGAQPEPAAGPEPVAEPEHAPASEPEHAPAPEP